ncbi:NTTRR-F1 domain, partial [Priestia megaterium]|uniref:NTTRR-F1 domain n=1 Tax=Priestia megaterium TaxID=1404 RepID=UPI000C026405
MTLKNLISDGSFETGNLSAWISSNATITSSHSHSGFYSVKLQGGATFSYISQFVPITPGQRLEVLVSLASLNIGLPISITIQVFYFDVGFNLLGNGLLATIPGNQIPHIENHTWMENYQTTTSAPLGSTQAFIVINTLPQVGTVDVLIDDIATLIATESTGPTGATGATGAT